MSIVYIEHTYSIHRASRYEQAVRVGVECRGGDR